MDNLQKLIDEVKKGSGYECSIDQQTICEILQIMADRIKALEEMNLPDDGK